MKYLEGKFVMKKYSEIFRPKISVNWLIEFFVGEKFRSIINDVWNLNGQ